MISGVGPGEPSLDPAAIVAALKRREVRYVVIGAFAAIAQQAPIPAGHRHHPGGGSGESGPAVTCTHRPGCADPYRGGPGRSAVQS